MKVLLFEYAVGSGEIVENNIFEEGKLMYNKLLNDFLNDGFSVITIIADKLNKSYYYNSLKNKPNLKIYNPEKDYKSKLNELLNNMDMDIALIIAPECNNILYDLTKMVEKHDNIINLGSSSKGIEIAGNKYLTYQKIRDYVKTPKTFSLKKYIVKEVDGCGGAHQIIDENYIIQEFIDGESYSTSFIVQNSNNSSNRKIYPLCLNKQYIGNEKYCGGETNISHPLKDKIIEESKKALKRIDGLNGYVGVDILIDKNNEIYVLEINPRITTSIVGLNINPSLAKLLVDNVFKRNLIYKLNTGKKFIRREGSFFLNGK
ncbi:tyramine--L-glutamate ligase [Methanothermococcus sp.]|uniref:tyramine--L-glutamate ligase n=1 Tax=Methanothermococcus sp. TaxID=2614238 RepID=UPI0025EDA291|nr:tyramine--L-glutamate ligase [Methanothermococcus sp.]